MPSVFQAPLDEAGITKDDPSLSPTFETTTNANESVIDESVQVEPNVVLYENEANTQTLEVCCKAFKLISDCQRTYHYLGTRDSVTEAPPVTVQLLFRGIGAHLHSRTRAKSSSRLYPRQTQKKRSGCTRK